MVKNVQHNREFMTRPIKVENLHRKPHCDFVKMISNRENSVRAHISKVFSEYSEQPFQYLARWRHQSSELLVELQERHKVMQSMHRT
jgi:hypothetical protein